MLGLTRSGLPNSTSRGIRGTVVIGSFKHEPGRPGPRAWRLRGGASVVVVLDLGRRQLAGGALPEPVDQLAGGEHHQSGDHGEQHPLRELAGLLGRAFRQLGHLRLHLLAGLRYFPGCCCRGLAHLSSSLSWSAVSLSSALARSGATLVAARRFLPISPRTATTRNSTIVTMRKPSHSGPPIATAIVNSRKPRP